jgi:segregation and condensation protein B
MDYFGINSAEDLPKIKEIFDDSFMAPTIVVSDELRAEIGAEEEEIQTPPAFVSQEPQELMTDENTDVQEATDFEQKKPEDEMTLGEEEPS